MSTELTIKKGRGVPRDTDLAEAELAVDLDDGTLYSKLGDGSVHALNETPDADNYGHWKLQVDYGTPYQVTSGATANFEGTNGIKVTRTGDTIQIDGSELDLDEEADNYQYWRYKINGFSTTNVLSTQLVDFQSGNGISLERQGYGIKISSSVGGMVIQATEPSGDQLVNGLQWMDSTTGRVWIWDADKWLEFPS